MYRLEDYDFFLPEDRIAQQPADRREASRLLVCRYRSGDLSDHRFPDILEFLRPGDLLLYNDTRVFPARLLGRKPTGGRVEILLLHYPATTDTGVSMTTALLRSSKPVQPGIRIQIGPDLQAEVVERLAGGQARVALTGDGDLDTLLEQYGQMPLPPYIRRPQGSDARDRHRYQTVYAAKTGAVAAPTAGLHFSDAILRQLDSMGVQRAAVTLHVGYGTFAPVRTADIRDHRIHAEYIEVDTATSEAVNQTRKRGGRIVCVGTTTARTVEFCCDESGRLHPYQGWCDLYIYPGYRFKLVDRLLTNFHLPRSSLLFLVSALAGRETILRAYAHAVQHGYRFFSYGDAMLLLP